RPDADARPVARREHVGAAEPLAGPLAFRLDFRITDKIRRRWGRQPEIDGVAVVGAGEPELEADRLLAPRSLHRVLAALHRAAERLRSGPQRRMQAALGGERLHDPALGDVG